MDIVLAILIGAFFGYLVYKLMVWANEYEEEEKDFDPKDFWGGDE